MGRDHPRSSCQPSGRLLADARLRRALLPETPCNGPIHVADGLAPPRAPIPITQLALGTPYIPKQSGAATPDLLDLSPAAVADAVREQAAALKNPPMTPAEVLDTLRSIGLVQSVAKLRELYGASVGEAGGAE